MRPNLDMAMRGRRKALCNFWMPLSSVKVWMARHASSACTSSANLLHFVMSPRMGGSSKGLPANFFSTCTEHKYYSVRMWRSIV